MRNPKLRDSTCNKARCWRGEPMEKLCTALHCCVLCGFDEPACDGGESGRLGWVCGRKAKVEERKWQRLVWPGFQCPQALGSGLAGTAVGTVHGILPLSGTSRLPGCSTAAATALHNWPTASYKSALNWFGDIFVCYERSHWSGQQVSPSAATAICMRSSSYVSLYR